MEVILSPKYQLLVPKNVRRELRLHGGQKFQVIAKEGVITFVPDRPLKEIRGLLKGMNTGGLREEGERI
ncbi:AbrB family transcriptional regulator [Candidatus Desantisbacteria bacterium CG_4_10_14_0_8_um_filter_48_22]|uniref:AbrB family transcriptional regulator n=1 Tax=Candidatus Desantisbacteria bacterium CG_4_10_14_0_8_um_filter_48_22 TaxID=1974543 RepID=A0A2M7S8C6_9BACT|nr:MAG: AbrB family transcriptional regulator [Candidatus Desantisbacteria bacterium CG02_land_8_20_14_3_00_49_13]PIZ15698.1 MAG: AbrB family transcriptional regulator [Candidatus Desantisbacteria bacterium CG_4_10_14_0_8_um_filter_48_22]